MVTFEAVTCPSEDPDGLHAPGLRFGDRRVTALLSAIVGFAHLIAGFDNPTLTRPAATTLDQPYGSRQATYDLRRLRRKGIIESTPHTHRYQFTPLGRRVAVLFTNAHGRVPAPVWSSSTPPYPTTPPDEARSPPPGANSTIPSTTTSTISYSPRDNLTRP